VGFGGRLVLYWLSWQVPWLLLCELYDKKWFILQSEKAASEISVNGRAREEVNWASEECN
jgi:hypothetical protein